MTERRAFDEQVVRGTPLDLDAFVLLMRNIEHESGFPNVDDFPDMIEYDEHDRGRQVSLLQRRLETATIKLFLINTEIAECGELVRKGDLDSHLLREEFADIFIRWAALVAALGFYLPMTNRNSPDDEIEWMERLGITTGTMSDIIKAKAVKNSKRPYRHGKAL